MVVDLILFQKIIIALAIGALVGLERERRVKGKEIFAGFRTFMLIALFGLLTGYAAQLLQNFLPVYIGLFAVSGLTISSYFIEFKRTKSVGMTTEVAFLLVYMIGLILFFEQFPYYLSIALGIILTLILVSKESMHKFAKHLTQHELRDAIIFAIIAFVILPILPNEIIGPFNIIINPYIVWLSMVFVLSVRFVAYIAMKIFGARKGLALTGVFGGFGSSTAVAVNMAESVRSNKKLLYSAVFATVIAASVMFFRQLVVASFFNIGILSYFLPFVTLTMLGAVLSFIPLKKSEKEKAKIGIGSPLALKPALKFALFFMFVFFISNFIRDNYGFVGIYAIAFLAGLVEVDAITISLATMGVSPIIAVKGILLAGLANTFTKWLLTQWMGTKKMSKIIGMLFAFLIVVGAILFFLI